MFVALIFARGIFEGAIPARRDLAPPRSHDGARVGPRAPTGYEPVPGPALFPAIHCLYIRGDRGKAPHKDWPPIALGVASVSRSMAALRDRGLGMATQRHNSYRTWCRMDL